MADVKPLKLVDQGAGVGRLVEFENGDTLPKAALPALSAADVGAVAADDARLSDAREWTATTVTQTEAEAGTATTRRAWTAQRVRQAIVAWWNSVSSAWGRGFVSSADAAAGRTALGLGSAATRTALGTTGALYSRDSILGTVSQSAGVPTGAIIERGSNANGEYVRFADGTQICVCTPASLLTTSVASGAGYQSPNFTTFNYPANFVATPNPAISTAYGGSGSRGWASLGAISLTSITMLGHSFLADGNITARVTLIGRWY